MERRELYLKVGKSNLNFIIWSINMKAHFSKENMDILILCKFPKNLFLKETISEQNFEVALVGSWCQPVSSVPVQQGQ